MDSISDFLHRTMLIERLAGVSLYLFVVFLGYYLIKYAKNHRNLRIKLIFILAILSLMSFFFVPDESKDLFRLWEIAQTYATKDFITFFNVNVLKSREPLNLLFLYLGGKIGIRGVLPLVSSIIFYGCLFRVLYLLYKKNNVGGLNLADTYLLIMCAGAFLEVISDLRSFVAICLVFYAFTCEIVFKKSFLSNVIIYILASLFHSTAIPLFVLRLLFVIFEKKSTKNKFLSLLLNLFVVFFIYLFGSSYVLGAIEKGITYFNNDIYSYFWEYLIGIAQLLLIIFYLLKTKKNADNSRTNVRHLLTIFSILLCVLVIEYNMFHRYILFAQNIFAVYYALTISDNKGRVNSSYIRLYCILILAIAVTRGNLCGYKFFLLG